MGQIVSSSALCLLSWANSEGHPHTEGTFTGTLVNVRDLRRNSRQCQGGSRRYRVVGSSNFARLSQSLHEGAHARECFWYAVEPAWLWDDLARDIAGF